MFFCSFSRVIDCLRWRRRAKQNLCDLSEQSAASTSFGHVNVIKKKRKDMDQIQTCSRMNFPTRVEAKENKQEVWSAAASGEERHISPSLVPPLGQSTEGRRPFWKGSRGVEWIVRWCWCLLLFLLPTLSGWWSLLFVLKTPLALSSINLRGASEEISFPLFRVCRGKALPCHDWIIAIIAEGRGLLCAWVLPVLLAQRGNSRGQNLPWKRHTKEGAVKATRPEQVVIAPFCSEKPDVRFRKERWRGHARLTALKKGWLVFFFPFYFSLLPLWDQSTGQLPNTWRPPSWKGKKSQIREMEGASPPSSLLPPSFLLMSEYKSLYLPQRWCADVIYYSHWLMKPLAAAVIKAHQYSGQANKHIDWLKKKKKKNLTPVKITVHHANVWWWGCGGRLTDEFWEICGELNASPLSCSSV